MLLILSNHQPQIEVNVLRELSYILLAPLNGDVICWNVKMNTQVVNDLVLASSNKHLIPLNDCVNAYESSISQCWGEFVEVDSLCCRVLVC